MSLIVLDIPLIPDIVFAGGFFYDHNQIQTWIPPYLLHSCTFPRVPIHIQQHTRLSYQVLHRNTLILPGSLHQLAWISFYRPFLGFLYRTFSIPRYSGLHLPLFLSHQCRCVPGRHDPFQKYKYSHPKKSVQWNQ